MILTFIVGTRPVETELRDPNRSCEFGYGEPCLRPSPLVEKWQQAEISALNNCWKRGRLAIATATIGKALADQRKTETDKKEQRIIVPRTLTACATPSRSPERYAASDNHVQMVYVT